MSSHWGKCALCGKECELTFEHIPPRKAFNWFPQKSFSGDSLFKTLSEEERKPWDFSSLPYNNDQRGMGKYSLCESCNSLTGSWYGDEYVRFARGLHSVLSGMDVIPGKTTVEVEGKFKPLLVIKQIISMFCSINSYYGEDSPVQQLRNFVLNKESTNFPKDRFRLGMYLFSNGIERRANFSVNLNMQNAATHMRIVSEISAYPLGYLLYLDPAPDFKMPCPDITCFSDCKYTDECTIKIDLPVYECNTIIAEDYRSKQELDACIMQNKKWNEDHARKLE